MAKENLSPTGANLVIRNASDIIAQEGLDFIEDLKEKTFIIGCNKYGLSMANWLTKQGKTVSGFINDFTSDSSFNKFPIFRSDGNYKKEAVINCTVEGQVINVKNLIDKMTVAKTISYFSLQAAFPSNLLAIDYYDETDEIMKNFDQYNSVFIKLADERSKKEFQDVLNFRVNRDLLFMNDFEFRINEQYFENFIRLRPGCNFVDAGGFDGFTSLAFAGHFKDFGKIFYFEPTLVSFELSKRNLIGINNVSYFLNGLWDKSETLSFKSDMGNSSKISDSGDTVINAVSLDETINEKVDFIKMDIEGAEQKALKGAQNLISKYKPAIAVCVYHRQRDFIQIPEYLLGLKPDYKVYFRHYTQGTCESVMYFV